MSIVDTEKLEVLDIPGFWLHPEKRSEIAPVMGLGNRGCTKIFGLGFEASSMTLVFHDHTNKPVYTTQTKDHLEKISTWICIETSKSGDYFYVGGIVKDLPTIGAIKFDSTLAPLGFSKLAKLRSKTVSRIKRIDGTDILLIGLQNELIVMSSVSAIDFTVFHIYNLTTSTEINSIAFSSRYIFYLTLGDSELQVIDCKKAADMEDCFAKENSVKIKPLGTLKVDLTDPNTPLQKKTTEIEDDEDPRKNTNVNKESSVVSSKLYRFSRRRTN